jgi:hypothetical protein
MDLISSDEATAVGEKKDQYYGLFAFGREMIRIWGDQFQRILVGESCEDRM